MNSSNETDVSPKSDDEQQEDGLQIFFNNPFLTLVKTCTMFVGELEFSDIPIDLDSDLMPLSYLYFLSFVILIVVVLMNLLNGLAVSDIREIRERAEIVAYLSIVDTVRTNIGLHNNCLFLVSGQLRGVSAARGPIRLPDQRPGDQDDDVRAEPELLPPGVQEQDGQEAAAEVHFTLSQTLSSERISFIGRTYTVAIKQKQKK